jgi:hypothetical protein
MSIAAIEREPTRRSRNFQKPLFCGHEMNAPSSAEQRTVDRKTHHRRKHNPRISGERHFNEDDAEVPFATADSGGAAGALYRETH